MERQLALLEERPDWRLDEETRKVGREGLAAARASLREARRRAAAEREIERANERENERVAGHRLQRPAA